MNGNLNGGQSYQACLVGLLKISQKYHLHIVVNVNDSNDDMNRKFYVTMTLVSLYENNVA